MPAGGFEFDGGTEVSPINTEQIQQATDTALKAEYSTLVVSGIFSPVNSSQEEAAADVICKHAALQHAGQHTCKLNACQMTAKVNDCQSCTVHW